MTISPRDGSNSLEVLPLDTNRWKNLTPIDVEWLRSSISTDEQELRERCDTIQKEAYSCFPYPCIRMYSFARLDASTHAVYKQIVNKGKEGNTIYLDFACCMGTDARKLVADGYPARNVFACDLRQEFLDYGKRLYNDASTCNINFLTANAFDIPLPQASGGPVDVEGGFNPDNVKEVSQLRGRVTHLYTGLFFHLFLEEVQEDLALRLGSLMKRESGSILYGRQMGAREPQDIQESGMFVHNPESWTRLWKKTFTELESAEFAENRVIVKAEFVQVAEKDIARLDSDRIIELPLLYWSVQII